VGVSAGSIAATSTFGETYVNPPSGSGDALSSEDIVFATPQGQISRILVTAQGVGLVDFALIPHLDNEDRPDASLANAGKWAARLPVPTYAIDDETASVNLARHQPAGALFGLAIGTDTAGKLVLYCGNSDTNTLHELVLRAH
jgi:hypothetical protein